METAMTIFRIYPDQNVWDSMLKGKFPQITIDLPDGQSFPVEYIYSNTTLDELERIQNSDQRNAFLHFLEDRSAKYIDVNHETEYAYFESSDPFEKYSTHVENKASTQATINAFQDFSYKMLSGDNTRSIDDIWGTIFGNMSELIKSSLNGIEDHLDDNMKESIVKGLESLDELTNRFTELFSEMIPSDQQNSLKALKTLLPYDSIEINNLEAEIAVKTIWGKVKNTYGSTKEFNERVEQRFERIFGNENNPKKQWKMLEKINAVYLFLNLSGYWQDENLEKKRKFIPSLNDAGHAFYAAYAHLFITRDRRFSKKLRAVYSYFNIGTHVMHYDEKT